MLKCSQLQYIQTGTSRMFLQTFQWHSIKAKVTLLTLMALAAGLWSLAFFASHTLRKDMINHLGEQQSSTASLLADQFDDELRHRITALETIAAKLAAPLIGNAAALQTQLEQLPLLQMLFNGGTFITAADGTAVASLPTSVGRVGLNFMDRDCVASALSENRVAVSNVQISKLLNEPVFSIAVPVRNALGQVTGALVGVIDLALPTFLDHAINSQYGKSGGYLLIAPQQRMIITASDRRRVMETLPAPGINPAIDRFLQGFEGTAVLVNPLGIEVLVTAKVIPAANWYVVVSLPTDEAFAPLKSTQKELLWAAIGLTLLVGGLIWWLLKQLLEPLQTTAKMLAVLVEDEQVAPPLPINRKDEIGQLIDSFNRMLVALKARQEALQVSDSKLKFLLSASPVTLYTCSVSPPYGATYISPNVLRNMGYTPEQFIQNSGFWVENIHPDDLAHVLEQLPQLFDYGIHGQEYRFRISDGSYRWMHDELRLMRDEAGEVSLIVGCWADVTERKQAQAALIQSEERYRIAFQTIPDAVSIAHLTDGTYLEVNEGFSRLFGWTRDEALGNTSCDLGIWQNWNDRQALVQAIKKNGHCENLEIELFTKEGKLITALVSANTTTINGDLCILAVTHDITGRRLAQGQIHDLAFTDRLTGLSNRRLLLDRLQQALVASLHQHHHGALLLVDLDGFKSLNETLGYDKGDILLQQVAARLLTCVRVGDTLARLGGDEFVILLECMDSGPRNAAARAETVAEKILLILNQQYHFDAFTHHSTASIGITLFGDRSEDAVEPLKRAELAMYQAKGAGRNTLRFYDPQMQTDVSARVALEAALREALLKEEFSLYYQAQVSGEHEVVGAEALLRWHDPKRGMVSPAEFIPFAEDSGLILPIGNWVLEAACAELVHWATRPGMAHLTMAVNVSVRQFQQDDFVDQVLAALKRSGARGDRLRLELTESVLVDDIEGVIAKMNALKGNGVGFSLDDFGTGYSSLSYLKRLPLDQLKIDQGFVRGILLDLNDAAIAKMVIALANSMGLKVVAEGVETDAQREFLAGLGCHHYQGYLFSRPIPADEFEALVMRG
jgi:diguanylate cyclase (GGDEF)-like protein/PAS domain S-box-containing protein